jgi:hypothetical protein
MKSAPVGRATLVHRLFQFVGSVFLFVGFALHGQTIQVSADSNIFGAGHSVPPAPGVGGAGVLPPEYDFGFTATSNLYVTFSSISGTVIMNAGSGDNMNNADGVGSGSADSSVNSVNGLSGITAPGAGYLVGVFENQSEPLDPAPSSLNFLSSGTNFTSLSPALNQVFFIGDGLTGNGTGAFQQFQIPLGATRLFLGLADAPAYHGNAGGYSDNTGAFAASFAIVPEPSVFCLLLTAAILAIARRRQSP